MTKEDWRKIALIACIVGLLGTCSFALALGYAEQDNKALESQLWRCEHADCKHPDCDHAD